jgi:hypothetical protein
MTRMANPARSLTTAHAIEHRMLGAAIQSVDRWFHVAMSLVFVAIVTAGFGPMLDARLLHPSTPRPLILHVHAAMFTGWVMLFVIQTTLISQRNIRWHRRLGMVGAVLGACMPFVGAATAVVIDRTATRHLDDVAAFLAVSLYDMLAFAITFGVAIALRRKREWHRRLMFIATCGLMSAAIARILGDDATLYAIYACVDGLIALGAVRDLAVMRQVHPAFLIAMPLLLLGQGVGIYVVTTHPPIWIQVAQALLY